jgi:hypothetical protein
MKFFLWVDTSYPQVVTGLEQGHHGMPRHGRLCAHAELRDPLYSSMVAELLEGLDGPLPLALLLSRQQTIIALLVIEGPLSEQMIDDHQDCVHRRHRCLLPTQTHFEPSKRPAQVRRRIGNSNGLLASPHWPPPQHPLAGGQAMPAARAAPPARCGSPARAARSTAERSAARSRQTAQDVIGRAIRGALGRRPREGWWGNTGGGRIAADHRGMDRSSLQTGCALLPGPQLTLSRQGHSRLNAHGMTEGRRRLA